MENTVLSAVKKLKKKGFYGIKVELEADLNRGENNEPCGYCEEGFNECSYCENNDECETCSGYGDVEDPESTNQISCVDCGGTGTIGCDHCEEGFITCGECNGDWEGDDNNYGDEQVCLDQIIANLASKLGLSIQGHSMIDSDDHRYGVIRNPFPGLVYARFYNDGSVDSELTFTISFDDPQSVLMLPQVVEAFRDFGDQVGNGIETSGAGMHMALLTDPNCDYSGETEEETPDWKKYENFSRSMQLLLPALYFLGTSNENTRGLGYRKPYVSTNKYTAIHACEDALEFRVFDTCYDNPIAILDNLVVISNCIKYWSDTYKPSGLAKIKREIRFGVPYGNELSRFYKTIDHIDILNAGLKQLKPAYYTVKDLKKQRKFTNCKSSVSKLVGERKEAAKVEYKEYEERFAWKMQAEEFLTIGKIMQSAQPTPEAQAEVIKRAKIDARQRVQQLSQSKQPEEVYINEVVSNYQYEIQGEYTLREV